MQRIRLKHSSSLIGYSVYGNVPTYRTEQCVHFSSVLLIFFSDVVVGFCDCKLGQVRKYKIQMINCLLGLFVEQKPGQLLGVVRLVRSIRKWSGRTVDCQVEQQFLFRYSTPVHVSLLKPFFFSILVSFSKGKSSFFQSIRDASDFNENTCIRISFFFCFLS